VVKNPAGTGPLTNVAQVNVGYEFACALLTNRQVRCWGDNDYGDLGNDDAPNDSFLPVVVQNVPGTGPLTAVTQLSVGDYLACARLANGQARCWADGEYGGMGNGNLDDVNARPTPVLNPAGNASLTGVTQLDVGDYTACARLGSGQARCWGYGEYGNVGRGTNDYNNPNTGAVVT
jgi:alpha-tubulin suppressor-like RCC1 family protein